MENKMRDKVNNIRIYELKQNTLESIMKRLSGFMIILNFLILLLCGKVFLSFLLINFCYHVTT